MVVVKIKKNQVLLSFSSKFVLLGQDKDKKKYEDLKRNEEKIVISDYWSFFIYKEEANKL
ncbi:hypothetical protein ACLZX5_05355 [Enterococcus faecium]